MTDVMPYIFRKRTERDIRTGFIEREDQLTVQGSDLKECERIFDSKWKQIEKQGGTKNGEMHKDRD